MKTGINFEIQDYLANQSELLELISGEYVRKGSGELFESNVKHLFPGDKEQAKLINPGSYIASVIYDWVSNYIGEPKELQNINYIDLVEGLLTTGCICFYQNIDTEKLEAVKSNKYYFDVNEKKEYFINIYEEDDENSIFSKKKKYFLLVETFKNNIFERKLFELSSIHNISEGTPIPLDRLSFLKGKAEKLKIEGIERLVIEKQVERPILEKVKTIIFSIEKKLAEIDKNFLDYTEQFKIFKNIDIPDNCYKDLPNGLKIIDFDKLGKLIFVNDINGSQGGLEIVRNTNDLLIKSIDYLDKQIRSVSSISGIPLFAFGIKIEGGNDSGSSKIKSAGLFYKKIEKYREVITKLFYDYWETFKIPDKDQILEFGEIVTTDISEIIEVQKTMLEAGIQSKKRAIMKINSTDEVEAKQILEEIIEEQNLFSKNIVGQLEVGELKDQNKKK